MKEKAKFQLLYFIRYFGDALFYPFMSIYLVSKGLSEGQLGIILAITPIITILVNPLWNFLIKDLRISRIVLKLMTIIEGVLIIVFTQISGFELYLLIITLIAFLCSPFLPIQDGLTATFAKQEKISYSSVRIFASLAYVIASGLAGVFVGIIGFEIVFIISGCFYLVTSVIIYLIKPVEKDQVESSQLKRNPKKLFSNKEFIKYLIFYLLVIGGVKIGDSFFGVYLTEIRNISPTGYGFIFSAFVFIEVVTMRFLLLKGHLIKEKRLFIIATILFAIRFAAYVFKLPLSVVILITMLRGVSWGIILYAHINFIVKIVSVENITFAIMFVTLLLSIFIGIGNFVLGQIIEKYGFSFLFMVSTAMVSLGLLIFFVFTPKTNK